MYLSTKKSREAIKYYRKRYAPKERVFAKTHITDEASAAVAALRPDWKIGGVIVIVAGLGLAASMLWFGLGRKRGAGIGRWF